MEHEKIIRINELTKLCALRPLTDAEQEERSALRKEYIAGFRANMEQMLGSVLVEEPDGELRPLEKKAEPAE